MDTQKLLAHLQEDYYQETDEDVCYYIDGLMSLIKRGEFD